jgi:hypothetical protein
VGIFCISRKQLLDRALDLDELSALADMLRRWYLLCAPDSEEPGKVHCEARIYAFARTEREAIREALLARLPEIAIDAADPDELGLIGSTQKADRPVDISPWRAVLSEPLFGHACLLLRLTLDGPVYGFNHSTGRGRTTFVFCGQPANGVMLVKAIWSIGSDESMHLVYRGVAWDEERKLLDAFEVYLGQCTLGPRESAASLAFNHFGQEGSHLFRARRDERLVMWLTRHRAEMPDDRGPTGFARRLTLPLLLAACCIAIAALNQNSLPVTVLSCGTAAYLIYSAGRIAYRKMQRVCLYYTRMRAGLGALYSTPVAYEQIDLSDDETPTLRKASMELVALGARHVCDVKITTSKSVYDGNRIFALDGATVSVSLLRKTENLQLFPPRPSLIFTTRFANGHRHVTLNKPLYRKSSRPQVTARCVLKEVAPEELLSLHRRHVDKLIAAGCIPVAPPDNAAAVLAHLRMEHEEGRQTWQTSPYSWGDAFHNAFKICRREYLSD